MKNFKSIPRVTAFFALSSLCTLLVCSCTTTNSTSHARFAQESDGACTARQSVLDAGVIVNWSIKVDPSTPPIATSLTSNACPDCGRVHSSPYDRLIKRNNSLSTTGFLVGGGYVATRDLSIEDENIKEILIKKSGITIPAKIERIFTDQCAVLLKMESEFPEEIATPLPILFDRSGELVSSAPQGAIAMGGNVAIDKLTEALKATLSPVSKKSALQSDGTLQHKLSASEGMPLFLKDGTCAGITFSMVHYTDDLNSLVEPMSEWKYITTEDKANILKRALESSEKLLYNAHLVFRKPQHGYEGHPFGRNKEIAEYFGLAFRINQEKVLIDVSSSSVANSLERLEKIILTFPNGETGEAVFEFMHKQTQTIVATLPPNAPAFPEETGIGSSDRVDVMDSGTLIAFVRTSETGINKYSTRAALLRTLDFDTSFDDQIAMRLNANVEIADLVFDTTGKLAMCEVTYSTDTKYNSTEEYLMFPSVAKKIATAPKDEWDPRHPVESNEEKTMGWIGLVLQEMDDDLAQMMNVSDQTRNGNFGGIVSKVYPDSAAQKAGIETGWILLSYSVDNKAKVAFRTDDSNEGFDPDMFKYLGGMPADYLNRLNSPFPVVIDNLVETLTKIGIGKTVSFEFLNSKNERVTIPLEITTAPRCFINAETFRWEPENTIFCNMTFEVREMLNLSDEAPGVVVRLSSGESRSWQAGLRRFEVVKRVNGEPVYNIKDFEAAVKDKQYFQFEVQRLNETRIIQFSIDPNTESIANLEAPDVP